MAREKRGSGGRRRRWPWVLLALGVLAVVLVGLALLARPMMDVKPQADAARDELGMAQDAIKADDLDAARAHVAAARAHVDDASSLVNGFGGDVWRWVPVAGGAVKDARHLVGALDQATSVAEIGTEVYPKVMQSDSLVLNSTVDLAQVEDILTALNQAGVHLRAAADDLAAVKGNTPIVGQQVRDARDEAMAKIEPLKTTYDDAEPVLEALPEVLGADGDRHYLVAIMNPAELRYSGGATLTLVPLTLTDGKVEFGETVTNEDVVADTDGFIKWPKVKGNPFHNPGKTRLMNATFSPNWSQSGEELLRAWEARFGQKCDGVITVDLQALARLMDLTGPVQAEGVGELNSGNLVKVLAGSYDYYNTEEQRKAINAAVVPAFREKLFEGGHFADKFEVLANAAKGRHFALYFRDPRLEDAFEKRGLAGDLSTGDHDYLGVFTQNTNSSKADYWQSRQVTSDVTLAPDGSATVHLSVSVANDSPVFTPPWTDNQPEDPAKDPRWGYYTRWAGDAVAVFLPKGAEVQGQPTMDGVAFRPIVRSVLGRPYFYRTELLEPNSKAVLDVTYTVPHAATVDGDTMTYHLDVDPQSLVGPEAVTVTVHLPDGYGVGTLPTDGWQLKGGQTLYYDTRGLDASPRWSIELSKG